MALKIEKLEHEAIHAHKYASNSAGWLQNTCNEARTPKLRSYLVLSCCAQVFAPPLNLLFEAQFVGSWPM
jgi:hypothetical protein